MAVLLGLFFAPAALAKSDNAQKTPDQTPNDHPSGKDRSEEPGTSGSQGKAKSDPDANANGGADKPGMPGGFDDDQDGNNGCGNDDDFEDDNNGWCGGKPKVSGEVEENDTDTETAAETETEASVLGVTLERTLSESASAEPAVLAQSRPGHLGPSVAADTLPATGRNLGILAAFALTLVGMGTVLVAVDRRRVAPIKVRVDR